MAEVSPIDLGISMEIHTNVERELTTAVVVANPQQNASAENSNETVSVVGPPVTPQLRLKLPEISSTSSESDNEDPQSQTNNLTATASADGARAPSPPPNCAICLGRCKNKCYTDSCRHQFCFKCLCEWSKVKPDCPLCKLSFKSIIHNVRSEDLFDEYHVQPNPQLQPSELWSGRRNVSISLFRSAFPSAHSVDGAPIFIGHNRFEPYISLYGPADDDAMTSASLRQYARSGRHTEMVEPYRTDRRHLYRRGQAEAMRQYARSGRQGEVIEPYRNERRNVYLRGQDDAINGGSLSQFAGPAREIEVFDIEVTSSDDDNIIDTNTNTSTTTSTTSTTTTTTTNNNHNSIRQQRQEQLRFSISVTSEGVEASGIGVGIVAQRSGGSRTQSAAINLSTHNRISDEIIDLEDIELDATAEAAANAEVAAINIAPVADHIELNTSSMSSGSSDECEFVLERKPPHLRTPELVSLNSESDSDVVFVKEDKPIQPPVNVALPVTQTAAAAAANGDEGPTIDQVVDAAALLFMGASTSTGVRSSGRKSWRAILDDAQQRTRHSKRSLRSRNASLRLKTRSQRDPKPPHSTCTNNSSMTIIDTSSFETSDSDGDSIIKTRRKPSKRITGTARVKSQTTNGSVGGTGSNKKRVANKRKHIFGTTRKTTNQKRRKLGKQTTDDMQNDYSSDDSSKSSSSSTADENLSLNSLKANLAAQKAVLEQMNAHLKDKLAAKQETEFLTDTGTQSANTSTRTDLDPSVNALATPSGSSESPSTETKPLKIETKMKLESFEKAVSNAFVTLADSVSPTIESNESTSITSSATSCSTTPSVETVELDFDEEQAVLFASPASADIEGADVLFNLATRGTQRVNGTNTDSGGGVVDALFLNYTNDDFDLFASPSAHIEVADTLLNFATTSTQSAVVAANNGIAYPHDARLPIYSDVSSDAPPPQISNDDTTVVAASASATDAIATTTTALATTTTPVIADEDSADVQINIDIDIVDQL